jgi:hypothetical protein
MYQIPEDEQGASGGDPEEAWRPARQHQADADQHHEQFSHPHHDGIPWRVGA